MSPEDAKTEVDRQAAEAEDAAPPEDTHQWSFVPGSDAPAVSTSSWCILLFAAGLNILQKL